MMRGNSTLTNLHGVKVDAYFVNAMREPRRVSHRPVLNSTAHT